jgi:hypothetical protein
MDVRAASVHAGAPRTFDRMRGAPLEAHPPPWGDISNWTAGRDIEPAARAGAPRGRERGKKRKRDRHGVRACVASEGDRGSLAARARGLWGRTARY